MRCSRRRTAGRTCSSTPTSPGRERTSSCSTPRATSSGGTRRSSSPGWGRARRRRAPPWSSCRAAASSRSVGSWPWARSASSNGCARRPATSAGVSARPSRSRSSGGATRTSTRWPPTVEPWAARVAARGARGRGGDLRAPAARTPVRRSRPRCGSSTRRRGTLVALPDARAASRVASSGPRSATRGASPIAADAGAALPAFERWAADADPDVRRTRPEQPWQGAVQDGGAGRRGPPQLSGAQPSPSQAAIGRAASAPSAAIRRSARGRDGLAPARRDEPRREVGERREHEQPVPGLDVRDRERHRCLRRVVRAALGRTRRRRCR